MEMGDEPRTGAHLPDSVDQALVHEVTTEWPQVGH